MEPGTNRIVKGMQEWLRREQNVAGLFSPSTLQTRYFQQLKMDYLRDLARSVRKDASKDERMTVRILKGEMKEMEKKLYPRLVVRFAVGLFRLIKAVVKPTLAESTLQPTAWMLKIDKDAVKKGKEQEAKRDEPGPGKVLQHRKEQAPLLEKKRVNQRKGLRLK